ncbi:MAG: hypothetical protein QW063_00485 [Candidatus Nanoarchaeia archaeon]
MKRKYVKGLSNDANALRFTSNKRGIEQPQVIIYILFVVILSLCGIYLAFTFFDILKVEYDFIDYASRASMIGSKFLMSPACFAAESSYTYAGNTYYQVTSGVIDWAKFNKSDTIPQSCAVSGEIWAKLSSLDDSFTDTIGVSREKTWPTRTFYVLILKDGVLYRGKLTISMPAVQK